MTTTMEIIKRKKKLIIFGVAIVILALLIYAILSIPKTFEPAIKPPVVSANHVKISESYPTGSIKTLNRLFSAFVKFNEPIGADVSGINIIVSPSIGVNKYSVSAEPEILWIEPVSSGLDPGWKDSVNYTITIKKGSTISSGAVLNEDYSFSFSNSTVGITMYAD